MRAHRLPRHVGVGEPEERGKQDQGRAQVVAEPAQERAVDDDEERPARRFGDPEPVLDPLGVERELAGVARGDDSGEERGAALVTGRPKMGEDREREEEPDRA